ncbi:hypothetical protein GGS24DRAFT_103459 [Hypoxylon argillaceum]|nr:hypothetical protein GGS24DRAFT_103459 [Hypoxylon argillaceum]
MRLLELLFFALFGKDRTCRGDRQPGSRKVIDLANHVLVCWLYFRSWYLLRMPMHSVAAFHLSFLQPLQSKHPSCIACEFTARPHCTTRTAAASRTKTKTQTARPFIHTGASPRTRIITISSMRKLGTTLHLSPYCYLAISLSSRHLPTSTLGNRIISSTA